MDWKEYAHKIFEKVKNFWNELPIKRKAAVLAVAFLAILVVSFRTIIKSNADNKNLSPQMAQYKKDGTMFIALPEKLSENDDSTAYIKGQTAPKAHVQIGYGIFGDTTTSNNDGQFTLKYDEAIKENTAIKITSSLNGKKISRMITILPSPKVQKSIKDGAERANQFKKQSQAVEKLNLRDKTFSEAKTMILAISPSIVVNSQSNNQEIHTVSESDKVTDFKVEASDSGVTVVTYLEPSESKKQSFNDKKAQEQRDKDAAEAKTKYISNVEAYEVRFKDYAIEYLIDKNTSTIYETTTDDSSVSQAKFTGDMDSRINFSLDGLQMIAFHHYAGNDAVAYFNDASHNSNKGNKMDPESIKNKYFKTVNLPF